MWMCGRTGPPLYHRDARAGMIRYQIKATNRGQFTVPPIFAESMYDRGIKARGFGGTLT